MQSRSSNSQSRLILIGCLAILLITGVLYFMKRLEASRLSAELNAAKTEKRETVDDLNGKVTDYVQKIEEMTKQLGNIQSKLTSCENEKETIQLESEQAKRAVDECHLQQSQHVLRQGQTEDELNTLRDECQRDKGKVKEHLSALAELQQAAKQSEVELDTCQTISTECQNQVKGLQVDLVRARADCERQQQQRQSLPLQSNQRGLNNGLGVNNDVNPLNNAGAMYRRNNPLNRQSNQVNQFQNLPAQSQSNRLSQSSNQLQEPVDKERIPSYPEEEDEEGNPLSDKDDVAGKKEAVDPFEDNEDEGKPLDDKADDLFDKDEDNFIKKVEEEKREVAEEEMPEENEDGEAENDQ